MVHAIGQLQLEAHSLVLLSFGQTACSSCYCGATVQRLQVIRSPFILHKRCSQFARYYLILVHRQNMLSYSLMSLKLLSSISVHPPTATRNVISATSVVPNFCLVTVQHSDPYRSYRYRHGFIEF
jgi:hypothetical protein